MTVDVLVILTVSYVNGDSVDGDDDTELCGDGCGER